MSEDSYEEENLDEFMLKSSNILIEKGKPNPEKNSILESLKQHLLSIYSNKSEMDNFFKTLNSVIFSEDLKLAHKECFILYPVIFSFNPKISLNYFNFFIDSFQICITEENKNFFTFLSEIFSEVLQVFYSDKNKNIIDKKYLLDKNDKKIVFKKILNFCEENIKTNKKLEQSFGCLILTEFIEKCPLVKDEKNLEIIFKKISDYLDDRWFECKLDLLNCTISLIFSVETKFKPYANTCLFRVMDYLTDPDPLMRKLSINIVYTLVFYCKEEILEVKENIIEFLNALKEDENDEIKEICKKILEFIQDDSNNNVNNINYKNKEKKNNNKVVKNSGKNNLNKNYESPKKAEKNYLEKNKSINNSNKDFEEIDSKINLILSEINKIKQEQEKFQIELDILMQKEENNYNILNQRFKLIEQNNKPKKKKINRENISNNSSGAKKENYSNYTEYSNYSHREKRIIKPKIFLSKQYEEKKIELLKNKFMSGKYNEALIDSKQNDKYLLNILPLANKNIIPKIEIAILEDSISRLNKRIFILCMEGDGESINDILTFYQELFGSKIKLKIMTKLSIKDALNFLRTKGINFLGEDDLNNIDKIIDNIKV